MKDRLFPKKLAYRDIIFLHKRGKDADWNRILKELKTEFRGSSHDANVRKERRRTFALVPAWIRSVKSFYDRIRVIVFLLFMISLSFAEFFVQIEATKVGIYGILIIGFSVAFSLLVSDEALALRLIKLRQAVIAGWYRSITFFRRVAFLAKSSFSLYFFKKNKRFQEDIFRLAPRDFSMLGFSPVNTAYHNLLNLEETDSFLQAYEDGVHKDLAARGLLHLARRDESMLKKLASDTENEYAEHASAWLDRLQKSRT